MRTWIAYSSSESGTPLVYVRPYPPNARGGKSQVSLAAATYPIWSRTSKELFYESFDGHIFVADYTVAGETFRPGKPRPWSDKPVIFMGGFPNYDLAPDGKRLVAFPPQDDGRENKSNLHVTFLFNFFDELKRTVK